METGNPNNPRIWEGADLFTAPVGTEPAIALAEPITDTPAWVPVGLLSEDGASESRDEDRTDHYSWGGRLVRTTRSKHKRQITVTCLEDNLVVFGLTNPGSSVSTANGVNTRTVRVPRSNPVSFLLELRDGAITRRRHIMRGEVEEVGEVSLSDSSMSAFALTITIYPVEGDVLYRDYDNDPQNEVEPDETDPVDPDPESLSVDPENATLEKA
ncbi:hypothetical protein [Streptomyces sp. SM12]|uniref:phage tail tube protein n=1 Tax=Streptomyces sp. SM12 TaxID=1071602 RepID=UPI0015E17010|nr:hypothetical protein [Streptomyces sp. SM12]